MLNFAIILLTVLQIEACGANETFLVSGGYQKSVKDTSLSRYVVSIRVKEEDIHFGAGHCCGGVIIRKRTILTAAHCFVSETAVKTADEIFIVTGTPQRLVKSKTTRTIDVDMIIPHSDFNAKTTQNDIALVIAKSDIPIDKKYTEIVKITDEEPQPDSLCTVAGWGRIYQMGPYTNKILYADLVVNTDVECKEAYGSEFSDGMFCAKSKTESDSCEGDSGGPLFCSNQITGIVSFGHGCGKPNLPGIYTDVYAYKQWIEQHANNVPKNNPKIHVYFCLFVIILNNLNKNS